MGLKTAGSGAFVSELTFQMSCTKKVNLMFNKKRFV